MDKGDEELRALLSPIERDYLDRNPLDYYLFQHKTKKCPHYHRHTEPTCPYYFYREGRRRHPVRFNYSWRPCKHVVKSGDIEDQKWDMPQNCPTGDGCPFAHSKVESIFHPARFKTQLCKNWEKGQCKNGYACGRAHGGDQLREPFQAGGELEEMRSNHKNEYRRRKIRTRSPDGMPSSLSPSPYSSRAPQRSPPRSPRTPRRSPTGHRVSSYSLRRESPPRLGLRRNSPRGMYPSRSPPARLSQTPVSPRRPLRGRSLSPQGSPRGRRTSPVRDIRGGRKPSWSPVRRIERRRSPLRRGRRSPRNRSWSPPIESMMPEELRTPPRSSPRSSGSSGRPLPRRSPTNASQAPKRIPPRVRIPGRVYDDRGYPETREYRPTPPGFSSPHRNSTPTAASSGTVVKDQRSTPRENHVAASSPRRATPTSQSVPKNRSPSPVRSDSIPHMNGPTTYGAGIVPISNIPQRVQTPPTCTLPGAVLPPPIMMPIPSIQQIQNAPRLDKHSQPILTTQQHHSRHPQGKHLHQVNVPQTHVPMRHGPMRSVSLGHVQPGASPTRHMATGSALNGSTHANPTNQRQNHVNGALKPSTPDGTRIKSVPAPTWNFPPMLRMQHFPGEMDPTNTTQSSVQNASATVASQVSNHAPTRSQHAPSSWKGLEIIGNGNPPTWDAAPPRVAPPGTTSMNTANATAPRASAARVTTLKNTHPRAAKLAPSTSNVTPSVVATHQVGTTSMATAPRAGPPRLTPPKTTPPRAILPRATPPRPTLLIPTPLRPAAPRAGPPRRGRVPRGSPRASIQATQRTIRSPHCPRGPSRAVRKGTLDLGLHYFCETYVAVGRCDDRNKCELAHPTYLKGKGYTAILNAHSLPQRCRHHERGFCEIRSLGRCQFAHISKKKQSESYSVTSPHHKSQTPATKHVQNQDTSTVTASTPPITKSTPIASATASTPKIVSKMSLIQPNVKRSQSTPTVVKLASRQKAPKVMGRTGPVLKNSFSLLTTLNSPQRDNPFAVLSDADESDPNESDTNESGSDKTDDDGSDDGGSGDDKSDDKSLDKSRHDKTGDESGMDDTDTDSRTEEEIMEGRHVLRPQEKLSLEEVDEQCKLDSNEESKSLDLNAEDLSRESEKLNGVLPSVMSDAHFSGESGHSVRDKVVTGNADSDLAYGTANHTAPIKRKKVWKCGPCGVVCNAEVQLQQHLTSNRHKLALEDARPGNSSYIKNARINPPRLSARHNSPYRRTVSRTLPSRAPAGYQYRAKGGGRHRYSTNQRRDQMNY